MIGMVPEQPRHDVVLAMDVSVEAPVGHKLVHKQELAAFMAPADELNEVAMPQLANNLHLGVVLFPPLTRALGHPFHGDVDWVRIFQEPPVHRPESTFTELLLF